MAESVASRLADRLFDAHRVIGRAEGELYEELERLGVPVDDLGWDDYDESVELLGVAADYRLSVDAQRFLYEAGFQKVYVNHVDKWETHYTFNLTEPFCEAAG